MKESRKTIAHILETELTQVSDRELDEIGERTLYRLHHANPDDIIDEGAEQPAPRRVYRLQWWLPPLARIWRLGHVARTSWIAAAVAMIVVLGVSIVALRILVVQARADAIVEVADDALSATSERGTRVLRVNDKIHQGERVFSPAGAVLALSDGSRVEMRVQTTLSLERANDGVRINLDNGGVIVDAATQRSGHLYVHTKDLIVSVVGTVFLVNAEEAGSRVAVVQGEVQVQQGTKRRNLVPGEEVATNPLMESHPVVEQVSWSRRFEARLALLQPQDRLEFEAASLHPVERGTSLLVTPVRCKGTDGELRPPTPNAPTVPQGRCVGENVPLRSLIGAAYDIDEVRIAGIPRSGEDSTYRIDAKAQDPATATREELRQMLQDFLAKRFKLKIHRETKDEDGYVLSIAKDGIKFKETSGDEEIPRWRPSGPPKLDGRQAVPGIIKGKFGLKGFAESLSRTANLPIMDKTGLAGIYDMSLAIDLILQNSVTAGRGVIGNDPSAPQEFDPPLPKVVEEQLGLRLERAKVPVEYVVVDRVEKATEN